MSFAFGPEAGGRKVGDAEYGVYWRSSGELHRTNMTQAEARAWIEECREVFPGKDPWDVWGICHAVWVVE